MVTNTHGLALVATQSRKKFSMLHRFRGFAVKSLVVALIATLASFAAPAAHADPWIKAGCKTAGATQKWGIPTFYGMEMNFKYCWTAGAGTNRIRRVRGSANCWANFANQVQNCQGPTNASKIKIELSDKSTKPYAYLYFWVQSRTCLTGDLNIACSKWRWHRIKWVVNAGGTEWVADRY
ncbi:hypothetical protein [Nocardioides marmotae]|uniref:Uncharacterized protein n=1 Tax=Nocardioides marmotae TaxID=2663857 RepID=A0A6I3IZZ6_9ACTN|nr:hypothetical protein [Nocardioides marmotae]MCR6030696.1 hypothetical protein [Gordonia jinghuaiqii]MBC9735536.1 hypothetical protein [Nocardioides marmotae]MTB86633.1 hypothetical protein [Nocardioides marmotae]MTB94331.1 hypothetical protein [Nocardioides marmotae]QKE01641.1 hypothetical protein HPC71_11540 [Nocardioides marmotae]